MYNNEEKQLIGKTITKILMSRDNLVFETNDGDVSFSVDGDCCSHSYFYDFVGANKILNKKVLEIKEVELTADDLQEAEYGDKKDRIDSGHIQVYGYKIIVEDNQWDELTGVFSFRNASNGYYGGSLEIANSVDKTKLKEVTTEYFDVE